MNLKREAVEVFVDALHKAPLNWGTWLELALLITDKDMVNISYFMLQFVHTMPYIEYYLPGFQILQIL